MVSKRTKDPWMSADAFGRGLKPGIQLNLLVHDIPASLAFQTEVIGAELVYADEDFAYLRGYGSDWILHADHTYADHPLTGAIQGVEARGAGVEIRVHGCDPDAAEARARAAGHIVLAGSLDKPHGLRECFLIDPDGYVWAPDVPLAST